MSAHVRVCTREERRIKPEWTTENKKTVEEKGREKVDEERLISE